MGRLRNVAGRCGHPQFPSCLTHLDLVFPTRNNTPQHSGCHWEEHIQLVSLQMWYTDCPDNDTRISATIHLVLNHCSPQTLYICAAYYGSWPPYSYTLIRNSK